MSFKLSEICEELNNIQLGSRPDELDGMHIEEVSTDEVEGYRDSYIRDVRSCLAGRRSNGCRGLLVRAAATDAIFSRDPVEAYLAWQLSDSWSYREGDYPDRYEEFQESPLVPKDGLPDGFVGPGDSLEYELPDWEAVLNARQEFARRARSEREEHEVHLRGLAEAFGRFESPQVMSFIKINRDILVDLLWETSDHRTRPAARPPLPTLDIEEVRKVEQCLDELVIAPAVRASHGDPVEARSRVRHALRIFCSGGKAPSGKSGSRRVKGFGLDPKTLIKASSLEARFQKALEAYSVRQQLWRTALEAFGRKASQLLRPNPCATFAEKVIAGVIHSFPKKWKEERINSRVVFHPADWDESQAEGFTQIRTKPLIGWGYLLGGFYTPAQAVEFLVNPETREKLGLLGPDWIEEAKRIVFGAYKKARQD
ncbi:MAG: hypothetical protein V3U81_04280 [Candidatus Binatia bacterium]